MCAGDGRDDLARSWRLRVAMLPSVAVELATEDGQHSPTTESLRRTMTTRQRGEATSGPFFSRERMESATRRRPHQTSLSRFRAAACLSNTWPNALQRDMEVKLSAATVLQKSSPEDESVERYQRTTRRPPKSGVICERRRLLGLYHCIVKNAVMCLVFC